MLNSTRYLFLAFGLLILLSWGCAPDEDEPRSPYHYSQVSILNRTRQLQTITVTLPRYDLEINCERARLHPAWYFQNHFDNDTSQTIELFSGQEIPVHPNKWFDAAYDYYGDYGLYNNYYGNDKPCHVVKIESPNFQPIVAFWSSDFPQKTFFRDADVPEDIPSDIHTIEMLADYSEVPKTETIPPWRNKPCDGLLPIECSQEERIKAATVPKNTTFQWGSSDTIRLFEPTDLSKSFGTAECRINRKLDFQFTGISEEYGKVISRQRTATTPPHTFSCHILSTTAQNHQLCLPSKLWRLFEHERDETWIRVSEQFHLDTRLKGITYDIRYIGNDGQLTRNIALTLTKTERAEDETLDVFEMKGNCASTALNCAASAAPGFVYFVLDGTYYQLEANKWVDTPTGQVYLNTAYAPIARTCGNDYPYYDYAIVRPVE